MGVLDDLKFDEPWLIPYILIILLEPILFSTKIIKVKYKPAILTYVIIICRYIAQFFISPEIYMLLQFILFFSTLILIVELFLLYRKTDYFNDYQHFIGGLIAGLGLQFSILVLNVSSNLGYDLVKLWYTIFLTTLLLYSSFSVFTPSEIEDLTSKNSQVEKEDERNKLGLVHFLLLGVMFAFAILWQFNPMRLASYDVLDMSYNGLIPGLLFNWPTFGFYYYAIVILIAAIISFILIQKIIGINNLKKLKIIMFSSSGIFCALNCFAILILDQDYTLLSTIYLTFIAASGVFSFLLYFSYLLHYYSFPSRLKTYLGYVIFVFAVILMAALEILVTWGFYTTFLLALIVLTIFYAGVFAIVELRKLKERLSVQRSLNDLNRVTGILFVVVVVINLIFMGAVTFLRQIDPEPEGNPKFMVWNIHNAIGLDDIFSLDRIATEIKAKDPDIVGLNEVDIGEIKTSFVDLVAYLANQLNMYYFYGPTFHKNYGNAIFSKYPFLEAENFHLIRVVDGAEPRAVIRAKFLINSENWTVYVNHLNTKKQDRLAQVDAIYPNSVVSIIDRYEYERTVWMGDFNFRPDSQEYAKLMSHTTLEFVDTHELLYPTAEFTGGLDDNAVPSNRIDYIFCSPDITPISGEVWCSLSSDHCAVITSF